MPRDGITEPIEPSDAASVGYEPKTPGDWTIRPETAQEALDDTRSAIVAIGEISICSQFFASEQTA